LSRHYSTFTMSIFGTAAKPAAPADVEVSHPSSELTLAVSEPAELDQLIPGRALADGILTPCRLLGLFSSRTSSPTLSAACRGRRRLTCSPWEAGTTRSASSKSARAESTRARRATRMKVSSPGQAEREMLGCMRGL
jgi:hypothetical protein